MSRFFGEMPQHMLEAELDNEPATVSKSNIKLELARSEVERLEHTIIESGKELKGVYNCPSYY